MQLLRAIQRVPGRRAGELASESGIPLNTVRDHLRVLEDEGLIRSETLQVGVRGRPPVVFHPVQETSSSPAASARVTGAAERGRMLRAVTPSADAEPLGADAQRQVDVLYEHLDDSGLEPALDERALTFDLAPCRYHDMIDEERALVCGVHARLVQDVLRQAEVPLVVRRLEPFVTAHRCRLLLAPS
jgi:predicted ArsR family transcriptional regulator